jgi:hypothetical protein
MSTTNFDGSTRVDDNGEIRYMCRSGGYVMVRRPRAMPFVLSEKEWARLKLKEKS